MDDVAAIPVVAAEKARSLELLGLRPGNSCLDVGCGTGPDLRRLASIVGASGRVVGVDRSDVLAADARRRASSTPLVELVVADAHRLPFADGEFDACRADRTLQHVADPETALAEMARVTRPGGRVVVTEFRWGLVAPGLDRAVTTAVLGAMASSGDRSAWLGHRLPEMLAAAGLIETETVTADDTLEGHDQLARLMNLEWSLPAAVEHGPVTAEQAAEWERALRALAAAGEAFAGIVIQHVVGRRP
jgi:SAM-dependent methyltransferase